MLNRKEKGVRVVGIHVLAGKYGTLEKTTKRQKDAGTVYVKIIEPALDGPFGLLPIGVHQHVLIKKDNLMPATDKELFAARLKTY